MKEKIAVMSHWDFAEEFTGKEAAYLIAGLDPSFSETNWDSKVRPIIERLKLSYYEAAKNIRSSSLSPHATVNLPSSSIVFRFNNIKDLTPMSNEIWSLEIENLVEIYQSRYLEISATGNFELSSKDLIGLNPSEVYEKIEKINLEARDEKYRKRSTLVHEIGQPIYRWAEDYMHEFSDQKFSRNELGRWIANNDFTSHYSFSTPAPKEKILRSNERNTLLIMIGGLCKALKLNYAPLDSNTVGKIELLVQQLGVKLSDPTIRDKLNQVSSAVEHNTKFPNFRK